MGKFATPAMALIAATGAAGFVLPRPNSRPARSEVALASYLDDLGVAPAPLQPLTTSNLEASDDQFDDLREPISASPSFEEYMEQQGQVRRASQSVSSSFAFAKDANINSNRGESVGFWGWEECVHNNQNGSSVNLEPFGRRETSPNCKSHHPLLFSGSPCYFYHPLRKQQQRERTRSTIVNRSSNFNGYLDNLSGSREVVEERREAVFVDETVVIEEKRQVVEAHSGGGGKRGGECS